MENTVALGTLITPAKNVRCGDNKYPVLSMTMHNGLIFQDEKFKKVIASKDTSDYKVVYRNQLVISFPIDEGVLAAQRITDAGIVSPAYGIWDIDEAKVLPEFLEYALRCDRAIQYYKANLRGSTARRRSLPTPTLLLFTVPLPPLEEQEEILDRIHKAGSIIEKREMQLRAFDELIKARFVELFGDPVYNDKSWETDTVENLCKEIYGGGTPSKSHQEYYDNGDIPWVSSKDMKSDVISDSQIHITQLGVDNSTAKIVPVNSVIMVIRSGILKHTLPVAINTVPVTVNQDLKVFIPGERILTRFLAVQFKMHEKDILSGVRAVTADNIEFNSLKRRHIIVPPIELQQRYVSTLEQVDKSKVAVQKSLDETQVLFDSLMQEYFG